MADRFHIAKNLWDAAETLVKQHYQPIQQALRSQSRALEKAKEEGFSLPSTTPASTKVVLRRSEQAGIGRRTDLTEIVELNSKEKLK